MQVEGLFIRWGMQHKDICENEKEYKKFFIEKQKNIKEKCRAQHVRCSPCSLLSAWYIRENLCGLIWQNTRAHTQSSTTHVITSSLFNVLYFFPSCVYLVTSFLDKQARNYIFVTKHFSPYKIRYVIITCFWLKVHNITIMILMLIHTFICLDTSAKLNRDVLKFYMNECHRNPILSVFC